jgi:hypothetical protein
LGNRSDYRLQHWDVQYLTFDPNLIFCPARYAARLSQAFTAMDAVKIVVNEVIDLDDICTSDGKYQFTL